jgi:hypothetical protein
MFYKKGIDITNAKQMFEFLSGHYMYDTLSSWNNLKSIANNVKLYNLGLDGDHWVVWTLLTDEFDRSGLQEEINWRIENWEAEHEGYAVGFNGRSGGYLVLYSKHNNRNVLPDEIIDYDDYDDFKDHLKEYCGGVKYFMDALRFYTKLVQDFDKLCDELRDLVNGYSKINLQEFYLESIVDEFNYDYEDDLKTLEIDPLVVKKENGELTVDLTSLEVLKALRLAFMTQLKHTQLNYSILDNMLTVKAGGNR